DHRRRPHPARVRVPRRGGLWNRHAVPRRPAERHPRREERRARVTGRLPAIGLVLVAEAAAFVLVAAAILAERPLALAGVAAAIGTVTILLKGLPAIRLRLALAFASQRGTALAGGALGALALPFALSASPYWIF